MTHSSLRAGLALLMAAGLVAAAPPPEDGMLAIGEDGLRLDPYEVTNRQVAAFLNDVGNPHVKGAALVAVTSAHALIEAVDGVFRAREGFADHPAVEVSFEGARAYCEWAGKRLPTEAEWERACQGPGRLLYPWGAGFGGGDGPRRANIGGDADGFARTAPVGRFPDGRSPWGVWDLSGNVWEWTVGPQGQPRLRGGSWADPSTQAQCTRSDDPTSNHTFYKGSSVGFRCAR